MTLSHADLVAARYALLFTRRTLAARNESAEAFDTALAHVEASLATPANPIADSGNPKTAVDQAEWNGWVSVTEAAQLLGCSVRRARQLAPSVDGRKRAGCWWIPRDALPTEEQ